MLCFFYVTLFVCGTFLPVVHLHYTTFGVFNVWQLLLSLFCSINLLICLWEIVLFFHISTITKSYQAKKKIFDKGELGTLFLFEHISLKAVFDPKTWTQVWSTYSLLDQSYSDTKSFGWNIDIGNGFSTLIPTILFSLGMTLQNDLMSPKLLGLVGCVSFYQEFYGTVIYFTQYIINKRWLLHNNTQSQIIAMVLFPNIIWMAFPALGFYASYRLIMDESFDMFTSSLL